MSYPKRCTFGIIYIIRCIARQVCNVPLFVCLFQCLRTCCKSIQSCVSIVVQVGLYFNELFITGEGVGSFKLMPILVQGGFYRSVLGGKRGGGGGMLVQGCLYTCSILMIVCSIFHARHQFQYFVVLLNLL